MLETRMARQGEWLFRYRSWLPLACTLPLAAVMSRFAYLNGQHIEQEYWAVACLAVSLLGLGIRMAVAGTAPRRTSGRNTRHQVADSLNTTGLYALCRNPLYVGNILIGLGIAMFPHHVWFTTVVLLASVLYYERIVYAEEAFLRARFGAAYEAWARETPAFLPTRPRWVKPPLPFSWRMMIRREYTALLVVFGSFALLEFSEHLLVENTIYLEPHWMALLILALATYVSARWLKKHTAALDVADR